jgi:hypothetical protein
MGQVGALQNKVVLFKIIDMVAHYAFAMAFLYPYQFTKVMKMERTYQVKRFQLLDLNCFPAR